MLERDDFARAIGAWLCGPLGVHDVHVENVVKPEGAGFSAQTYLFEARWADGAQDISQAMVARVAPTGPGLFPTYDGCRGEGHRRPG